MTFYKMRAVSLGLQPFSQLTSPMEIIRQFTPNWFAATMGTGILAIALAQLPDAFSSLGKALWLFNIALFTLFSALYAARWILFFHEAKRIFGHSVVSMFFGCIPMGLATIINGFLIFGLPSMGSIAIEVATVLWWIDVGMAALCGIAIPYLMFTRQSHAIDQMTAVSVTEPAHSGDTVTEFQDSLQKVRSTMFGLRDALEATLANPSQTSN